jgi:hypothetical protein
VLDPFLKEGPRESNHFGTLITCHRSGEVRVRRETNAADTLRALFPYATIRNTRSARQTLVTGVLRLRVSAGLRKNPPVITVTVRAITPQTESWSEPTNIP